MLEAVSFAAAPMQRLPWRDSTHMSERHSQPGFVPGFLDQETGTIYLSCLADGHPAPVHLLDGLPAELGSEHSPSGAIIALKASVVAGYVRDGRFFTREQAAGNALRDDAPAGVAGHSATPARSPARVRGRLAAEPLERGDSD
jgi:hypothetical protein